MCRAIVRVMFNYIESRIRSPLGSHSKNPPTEKSAAAFKKDSAKPPNSFPSMEDQLKDLLKGNSEESLIAPGHNSTRFHLDYTNAGECRPRDLASLMLAQFDIRFFSLLLQELGSPDALMWPFF